MRHQLINPYLIVLQMSPPAPTVCFKLQFLALIGLVRLITIKYDTRTSLADQGWWSEPAQS
jgi:hypothetical protein